MASNLQKYNRIYYKNNTPPPINQTNLNKIEEGITVNRDALIALQDLVDNGSTFSVIDGKVNITYET